MAEKDKPDSVEYIASMCVELTKLTEQSGFDTGAYLLKMASLECANLQASAERSARKEAP